MVEQRLRGTLHYDQAINTLFEDCVRVIEENVANDKYLATVEPLNVRLVRTGTDFTRLADRCKTTASRLEFLRRPAIDQYLTEGRQGANAVAGLKARLQPQLDFDSNKTPDLLRAENPALYDKVRNLGEGRVRRMEYNVDPDHEWTKFMINHDAVVGAGPSGTTSFTLGLVEKACEGESFGTTQMAAYAVAMALFSFWQRKKRLLKYQSAVHTWNEVCAALDHHRGANEVQRTRDGFLQVSDTGKLDDENGCDLYAYPNSFNNLDGRPDYGAGGTTWADLMG